jgi:predicted metal-dependent hydrolase
MASAQVDWRDGALVPYLGGRLQVVLDPSQGRLARQTVTMQTLSDEPEVLKLGLPHSATQAQIRDAAQAWLMRQAKQLFEERLNHFAPQLGVAWRRLSLSSAGTRWGSASVDGSIRLNWRLIHFKLSVIDYVVVHELSHLRVMDHSPRFWDTVRTIVPDYAELRSQLKDELIPTW